MGAKPRKKPVNNKPDTPTHVDPDQTGVSRAFDITAVGPTTIKIVLERPPHTPPVKEMKIVGGKLKRVGSPMEQKTPGGVKLLTIQVLYRDAT